MQLGNEGEFIRDKMGNRELVRKKAEQDKDHAGKKGCRHGNRIDEGNFRFVQRKGERNEKAKEHGE